MIAVILSACLLSDPSVCREHRIPLTSDISAIRCMMAAMPYLAQWSEKHPRWRIVRWQCSPGSQKDI